MSEGKFTGDPARLDKAHTERLGPFTFGLVYRHVGSDQGYTIHVMGPVDGEEEEILRFDCFETEPHYHLGVSYRNAPIIPIKAADPLEWSLGKLRGAFPELLAAAGGDQAYDRQWSEALDQLLSRLAAEATGSG